MPFYGYEPTYKPIGTSTSPISTPSVNPYIYVRPEIPGIGYIPELEKRGKKPLRLEIPEEIIPAYRAPTVVAYRPPGGLAKGSITIPRGTKIASVEVSGIMSIESLAATDIEKTIFKWLCDNEIPSDFETVLLGGRIGLRFAKVPFLLAENLLHSDFQAMRLFEQNSGKQEEEKDLLERTGYQVIDISPLAILSETDKVLSRVLER